MATSMKIQLGLANQAVQRGLGKGFIHVDMKFDGQVFPNITKKVNGSADKALEASMKALNGKIVTRTPRDTGRAQFNWIASVGGVASGRGTKHHAPGPFPSASAVRARNNRAFTGIRAGQKPFLYNNLPYIPYLERGRSKQAPHGWITLSLLEMYGDYPKRFKDIFDYSLTRDQFGEQTAL
jgi:hypothetical protein